MEILTTFLTTRLEERIIGFGTVGTSIGPGGVTKVIDVLIIESVFFEIGIGRSIVGFVPDEAGLTIDSSGVGLEFLLAISAVDDGDKVWIGGEDIF